MARPFGGHDQWGDGRAGFRLMTGLLTLAFVVTLGPIASAAPPAGPAQTRPQARQSCKNSWIGGCVARVGKALRIPARLRLARMRLSKARRGVARTLKKTGLPARYRLARIKLKRSRLARGLSRASKSFRGGLTWLGDRVELNTPTKLGRRIVRGVRGLSPLSLGAFAMHKFKQDPVFLSAYGTWSVGFSNAIIPAAMAMGMDPLSATGLRLATGLPIDLGALYWRQHHLMKKKDPKTTWGGTLRQLGKEYGEFVVKRRQENRDFMAGRKKTTPRTREPRGPRPAGGLRSLAAPLMGQLPRAAVGY